MRYLNQPLYPDACRLFLAESGRARTRSSQEAFITQLRVLQQRYRGKSVQQFTRDHLAHHCIANDAAPNTQLTRRALLMSFFSWATFAGLVREDPSRDLKFLVHPAKRSVRRNNWLPTDEFLRLLRGLPNLTMVERRDRMVVFVGALIGLRSSNLSNIRWSMFDPELTSINVTVKGQKLETYGVPEVLRVELAKWRAELVPAQGSDGPVFPAFHFEMDESMIHHMACNYNVGLERGGVLIAVKRAGRAVLGLENLCPHDLRRSYASYLESQGFGLEDICRALGHESMATTSVYMDRNPNRAAAIGRGLNVSL